jgi:hypothetical protein
MRLEAVLVICSTYNIHFLVCLEGHSLLRGRQHEGHQGQLTLCKLWRSYCSKREFLPGCNVTNSGTERNISTFRMNKHRQHGNRISLLFKLKKLNSVAWVRERTIRPSDRRLSSKLVPIFADRGSHVVSVTNPYGRILGFLDRSRYFPFK